MPSTADSWVPDIIISDSERPGNTHGLHVLVSPDAFKGSLTAIQAADAIMRGVLKSLPDASMKCLPVADGGEGTLEALLAALPGHLQTAIVSDATGQPICAEYAVMQDGTAVIEVARIVGFTQPGIAAVPLCMRTTVGIGELIRHCLDQGVRRFIVGLGGSSTCDGGIGMLSSLGMQTEERCGSFESVDLSCLDDRLKTCYILLLTDVDNPLCGEQGAAVVYGPQKGALPSEVLVLDLRLRRFSQLVNPALADAPGTGAAGGLGYALQLIGGEYCSGAEKLLEIMGFDAMLHSADWVITGEGRSDVQTLYGKAPGVVARHAHSAGVPVTLISGQIDSPALPAFEALFEDCHALVQQDIAVQQAMNNASQRLFECAEQAARQRVK